MYSSLAPRVSIMFNPDEIRDAFNMQHGLEFHSACWVRLDLSTGPVLARRNMGHYSSPIYVAVLNDELVRHWMVTIKRQLKSNGTTHPTPEIREAWAKLIGLTGTQYLDALEHPDMFKLEIARYERGPKS